MALFGLKKEKKVSAKKAVVAKKETTKAVATSTKAPVYIKLTPRVTEKAGIAAEKNNVYTFEVTSLATKHAVAQAVKSSFKVTPIKINIVNLPSKSVFVRGKFGTQSGVKKALVFLKKGDKIEIA